MGLTDADERLHPPPEDAAGLWSDNFWFSVADRDADVYGILHLHAAGGRRYQRVSAFFVIDGVQQQWATRQPLVAGGPLGDERLRFSIEVPFQRHRWTFDGPRFGFDLTFTRRFDAFDYADCTGGNPLAAHEHYGGHYEQAMECRGTFVAHGGPRAGEPRPIACWAHRDHSWTLRFARPSRWEPPARRRPGHFWPSVQLPSRHLNSFGWLDPAHPVPDGTPRSGGWIADASGARALAGASAEARFEDDGRTAMSFRLGFELAGGEHLTVLTARKLAHTRNGLMRDENDAEARLDCHEPFYEFEVLETGEHGYGVVEYSMEPAEPRWRY